MITDLLLFTALSLQMKAIMPILYMWSAMLSGPITSFLTQPVLLVFCTCK